MTSPPHLTPFRSETPTVTLEVMAREAAVSQWSDRPVAEALRYHLQIRSLTNSEAGVEIRGDRTSFLPLANAIAAPMADMADFPAPIADPPDPAAPFLEPVGLTQYRLHLGNLQTTRGDREILLGAVQLADLAAALAQLEAQVRWLPLPLRTTQRRAAWKTWGTAAAGMVAAVGLTTTLWHQYPSTQPGQVATESPSLEDGTPALPRPASEDLIESAPPSPLPPDSAASPVPTEGSGANEAPESLANPPPVGAQSPNSAIARSPRIPAAEPPPTVPKATAPSSAELEATPEAVSPPAPATGNAPPPIPGSAAERPQAAISEADTLPAPAPSAASADSLSEAVPSHAGGAERSQPAPMTPLDLSTDDDLLATLQAYWTPPTDLTEPLVYRLDIAADGTLAAIVPQDARSAQAQDDSLPPLGTVLTAAGEPRPVWVLLYPNGQVTVQAMPPEVPSRPVTPR